MNDQDIMDLDFPNEIPERLPGFLLWQSSMCWQRKINKTLDSFDLTYTQFIVLLVAGRLNKSGKKVYQHQIARYSRIDRMMTSRVLSNLEKKQLIERIKQSDDARTNIILLTPKGIETLTKSFEASVAAENDFFDLSPEYKPGFLNYMKNLLPEC